MSKPLRFQQTELEDGRYIEVLAFDDRQPVGLRPLGNIGLVHKYPPGLRVASVETRRDRRQQGIATKLYEFAATLSCQEYGGPLASDVERTAASQRFWEKQVKKGRATCVESAEEDVGGDEDAIPGRGGCRLYRLNDCAVRDLSGACRRPTKRKKKR